MTQSIEPSRSQIEAYFNGLRMNGDPEMLEDLGIPSKPDSLDSHVNSARELIERIQQLTKPHDSHEAITSESTAAETLGKMTVRFCGDCLIDIERGQSCNHIDKNGDTRG